MKKYFENLIYIFKHKFFVMKECFRYGLYWRGVLHDNSKFLPSEFFAYANFFHGDKKIEKDPIGYFKPTTTDDDKFDFAWLLHQKRNKHHFQWWILPDGDSIKVFEMPEAYWKEMCCDWIGAGKAQGNTDMLAWYSKNRHKIILHPRTRDAVEKFINYHKLVFERKQNIVYDV
jgi:hypothetical protein